MTENPTDRPEAVEPQGDLHAAFVAALQGRPAHQDGAGIVRRVAPWAAHELAERDAARAALAALREAFSNLADEGKRLGWIDWQARIRALLAATPTDPKEA